MRCTLESVEGAIGGGGGGDAAASWMDPAREARAAGPTREALRCAVEASRSMAGTEDERECFERGSAGGSAWERMGGGGLCI